MEEEIKIKELYLSNDPHIHTRSVLFDESEDEIKDKNKKQFITCQDAYLDIILDNNTKIHLYAEKGYKFDGATIPFGIGKGNMKLLIPALFHDIMCDNKKIIDYNRKLSSLIFREALIHCGVNKAIASIMSFFVDNYQKFMNWKEK